MEPSLKVLLFAVAYVVVCMGICLLFKVGCYEDEDEDENPEFLVDVQNHQNEEKTEIKDEEDYFHTEGSTYL